CGYAVHQCRAAASYAAIQGDVGSVRPQQSGIINVAVDHQPAAAGRFKRAGIVDDVGPGIDIECIGAGCNDRALVDEDHHPIAEVSGAGDSVVHVGERDVGDRAEYEVFGAVGKGDLPAAFERDAVLDQLKIGLVAGRVQCDRPGVVDRP